MEGRYYIYAIGVLIGLGIVAFVILWTRDVFKSTVGALATALVWFLISTMVPSWEAKVTSNRENIVPGVNLQVEHITFIATPASVEITIVITVTVALVVFGLYLHLENKDKRKYRK